MSRIHNPFPQLTKVEANRKLEAWSKNYNRSFNGNIYHYTNVAALSGIVSNRALFCTDYRQLNDSAELSLGLEVVEAVIALWGQDAGLSTKNVEEALNHLALLQQNSFHISMFTASFSAYGNDLTQWRAYAPNNGVSIGFKKNDFQILAEKQHFVCGAVRYLGAPLFNEWLIEQLAAMKEGLERMDINEDKLRERASGDPPEQVDTMVQFQRSGNLERWVSEVAGLLKNPNFREEYEWRCLFVSRENTPQPRKKTLFRNVGSKVIRYVKLDLSDSDLSELITEVIIGPGNGQLETFQTVCDLLRSEGVYSSIECPNHTLK